MTKPSAQAVAAAKVAWIALINVMDYDHHADEQAETALAEVIDRHFASEVALLKINREAIRQMNVEARAVRDDRDKLKAESAPLRQRVEELEGLLRRSRFDMESTCEAGGNNCDSGRCDLLCEIDQALEDKT